MIKIYDFNDCKITTKTYAGHSGRKMGVYIDGELWMLKYPKKMESKDYENLYYTMTSLSEYLGSHIYEILGYDAQKTMLGIRNNQLVVACKDFETDGLFLQEFDAIKNFYDDSLQEQLDSIDTNSSPFAFLTSLEVVFVHFKYNRLIADNKPFQQRFWDCIIIDGLIGNDERSRKDWGLLHDMDGNLYIAPIYDNGGSFSNKMNEASIEAMLNDTDQLQRYALNGMSAYMLHGKQLSFEKMINLGIPELDDAIVRVTPKIIENMGNIKHLFFFDSKFFRRYKYFFE